MKKIFLSLAIIMSTIACSEEPNEFTASANAFLDAIDDRSYYGIDSAINTNYNINGRILAETHSNPSTPSIALRFINSKDNGVSTTEAIYQQIREPKQFRGIKIENGGSTLSRTDLATTEATIDWNTYERFAIEN